MELNFLGTVSITKHVLPHMVQRGTGTVTTVSSVVGIAGAPLATGYSASKHALQVRGRPQSCFLLELCYHYSLFVHSVDSRKHWIDI